MSSRVQVLSLRTAEEIGREFRRIGVDSGGIEKMLPKSRFLLIKLKNIPTVVSNILKQEILSKAGEAAVHRSVITFKTEGSDILLMGTFTVLKNFLNGLTGHYFGIPEIKSDIEKALERYTREREPWVIREKTFDWDSRTFIMGILNITPDSFSDGGDFFNRAKAIEQGLQMFKAGADLIDIGGESTRPGSDPVTLDEELDRVIPVITGIRKQSSVPISIDSYKPAVVTEALKAGADIINDITGGSSEEILKIASEAGVPLIIMHMKGTPKNMQNDPVYENLMDELIKFFHDRVEAAESLGLTKLCIDPGIGFGKRIEDNLEIIKRLDEFRIFGYPVLIGPSRKSFIGKILGGEPKERLEGTAAAVSVSVYNNADIIRVHDVNFMAKVIKMTDAIKKDWVK
ncbi:MAG TPA: dihydropteroate synthase [Firmicutes bacterium]|nr:dihydropteroate synthase [Bacillota bacterium]